MNNEIISELEDLSLIQALAIIQNVSISGVRWERLRIVQSEVADFLDGDPELREAHAKDYDQRARDYLERVRLELFILRSEAQLVQREGNGFTRVIETITDTLLTMPKK